MPNIEANFTMKKPEKANKITTSQAEEESVIWNDKGATDSSSTAKGGLLGMTFAFSICEFCVADGTN